MLAVVKWIRSGRVGRTGDGTPPSASRLSWDQPFLLQFLITLTGPDLALFEAMLFSESLLFDFDHGKISCEFWFECWRLQIVLGGLEMF